MNINHPKIENIHDANQSMFLFYASMLDYFAPIDDDFKNDFDRTLDEVHENLKIQNWIDRSNQELAQKFAVDTNNTNYSVAVNNFVRSNKSKILGNSVVQYGIDANVEYLGRKIDEIRSYVECAISVSALSHQYINDRSHKN